MVRRPVAGNSHIIERPRLMDRLDATKARAMLLIAPAGYGKTTLSRQWFGRGDKPFVRYRATQASSDVAALAAGLARAAEPLVPGAPDRILPVIRSSAAPSRDVEIIAEVLVDVLRPFPAGGWIAFDDYHFLVGSVAAERLIEVLADRGAPRLLISTRRRPSWATARRTLYGEVDEVGQADLAFMVEEAALLLPHIAPAALAKFVGRARGWPAVIRLASVSGGRLPEIELPPALHQYFAEELFQTASPAMQDALVCLALLPTLQPRLLELAVGAEYRTVCKEAVGLGFLTEDGEGNFDFHPLLRAFLAPRARQMSQVASFSSELVEALISDAAWDEAFALATSFQHPDLLPLIFERGLDDLLMESRISTLEKWVIYATQSAAAFPLLDLAEAEVARRFGNYEVGEVRALQAARTLNSQNPFCARAWAVAGECAHLACRPSHALKYHKQAETLAMNIADVRRAVWGQHVAAVSFEVGDARHTLERLKELDDGTPASALRASTGDLNLAILEGGSETVLADAARHVHLLRRASNPLVTTSFLSRYAWACIMSGQYARGSRQAEEGVAEAERTQATFALIHLAPVLIAASIGLRRFRHAQLLLDDLHERLRSNVHTYEALNADIYRARLRIATGSPDIAAAELDDEMIDRSPTPALGLEAASVRALALSVTGEAQDALQSVDRARKHSSEAQGVVLSSFARYIQSAVVGDSDTNQLLDKALELLHATENYDSFVTAYRAYPPLLQTVVRRMLVPRKRLTTIVRNAMDLSLAADAGVAIEPAQTPYASLLTRREREVYELLCRGLSNREIADALVISHSTAKIHVRHILKKLGVTTRARAMRAAQEAF